MELVESDASTFYYQFPENGNFFWKNNRVSNFNRLSTDCGYKNYLNGGFWKFMVDIAMRSIFSQWRKAISHHTILCAIQPPVFCVVTNI